MFKGIACGLLLLATPVLAEVVLVEGYVRLLPPGSPDTAAFLLLKNEGDRPVALIGAASPEAARAELHTHFYEGGMMKMRRVEALPIPARGELALKPGGAHIMLFGVRALPAGASLPLTLTLDDGQILELRLPQRPVVPLPAQ